MSRRVLIRADATAAMGTGHVMRCFAVAEALAESGAIPVFAAAAITPALADRLETAGFALHRLPGPPGSAADLAATLCRMTDAGALLIDGYHFDAAYRRMLKAAGKPVAAFDDLADAAALHADLVINAGLDAGTLPYDCIAPGARLLLGPAYAPLRRDIREAARRPASGARDGVLVSFGGSDPRRLTAPVIRALDAVLPPGVRIVAVVGGSHPEAQALAEADFGPRAEVHVDTPAMGELMAGCGLAVSAGGGTIAELAALAVPALLVVVADNQHPTAMALKARGLCDALSATGAADAPVIAKAALALWNDPGRRAAMAAAFRAVVDGEGVARIAQAILGL
jgi:UDP-2,4-diacetamido-2,4,6-trideoxy-beta-L-altropyranose hydrolase